MVLITVPEDLVPAAHNQLTELQNMRANAQQALQRCIKLLCPLASSPQKTKYG